MYHKTLPRKICHFGVNFMVALWEKHPKVTFSHFLVNLFFYLVRICGLSLDFLSDHSFCSTFVGGYKSTAIAEKREENPEILIYLVRKRLARSSGTLNFSGFRGSRRSPGCKVGGTQR